MFLEELSQRDCSRLMDSLSIDVNSAVAVAVVVVVALAVVVGREDAGGD